MLAPADVGDPILDSAVFIKAGSLQITASAPAVGATLKGTSTRSWTW
jgi:hypothetical protein